MIIPHKLILFTAAYRQSQILDLTFSSVPQSVVVRVQVFGLQTKFLGVAIQIKPHSQYFAMVQFRCPRFPKCNLKSVSREKVNNINITEHHLRCCDSAISTWMEISNRVPKDATCVFISAFFTSEIYEVVSFFSG